MDANHYVDIFATKGIEYLLVIAYLTLFIVFVRALRAGAQNRGSGRRTESR